MKNFLFGFILTFLSLLTHAQNFPPTFQPIIPFQTGLISFPDTNRSFSVYYTYKIPYQLLVFAREDNKFNASSRIIVEISDNDGKLIKRDIKDNKITVDKFEDTNNPDHLLQDFLEFIINPGDYKFSTAISDMNSSGERPLKPIELKLIDNT